MRREASINSEVLHGARSTLQQALSWASEHRFAVIFVVALLARLATVAVVDGFTDALEVGFRSEAGSEFTKTALNILAGNGYAIFAPHGQWVPSAYMPPGYVFFLVGVFGILEEGIPAFLFVQILHAVLGALLCWILYLVCKECFNEWVALVGALSATVYPILAYISVEIHSVTFYVLLNVAVVLFLLRFQREQKVRHLVIGRVLLGSLILVRGGAAVAYLPAFSMWI
jgi:hypothetical protein